MKEEAYTYTQPRAVACRMSVFSLDVLQLWSKEKKATNPALVYSFLVWTDFLYGVKTVESICRRKGRSFGPGEETK